MALRAFYARCGSPKYPLIKAMAERLSQLYGVSPELIVQAACSATALSETLHGRRKGLPTPAFITVLVLCCQRLAFESFVISVDPGIDGVREWQKILQDATARAERLGLPHQRGRISPAGPTSRQSIHPQAMFTADPSSRLVPVNGQPRLTDAQYELVASCGRYGQPLWERACARDPHALYQVAVILAADPARDDEVISLLTASAAAVQPQALDLLDASPERLNREAAIVHARDLTDSAKDAGFTEAAWAFAHVLRLAADSVSVSPAPVAGDATAS